MSGIYGIFDSVSSECLYIGLTHDFSARWKSHLRKLKAKTHPQKGLIDWWIINGERPDRLTFKVLETCSSEELNAKEIFWFKRMKPKFYGKLPSLNETWSHTDETKEKLRQAIKPKSFVSKVCKACKKDFEIEVKRRKYLFCSADCRYAARFKLSEVSETKMRHLYFRENMNLEEIGSLFGVSSVTVANRMTTLNIQRKPQKRY